MFNLKNSKTASPLPWEKYLREENIGPKADDSAPIAEKHLPHRIGTLDTITEDQLDSAQVGVKGEVQITENQMNKDTAKHRTAEDGLLVPPISALVEQMRQERLAADYKVKKESNWTVSFNDKKQNGELPAWPKMPEQHNKPVLNNDPQRFEGKEVKPLVGNITTADVDRAIYNIKHGASREYDVAILAILEKADQEKRQLTEIEQTTVSNLKIARTKTMIEKYA